MIKNKIVLVTGAGGFIGSNLVERLLEFDNYVVMIDNFNSYYAGKEEQLNEILSNYRGKNYNYSLIKGDLVNPLIYNKIEEGTEYVFHLAAQAGVRYSFNHQFESYHNNLLSTGNVFSYCNSLKRLKKVVFASSSSVYGENCNKMMCDEQFIPKPISPYAISKVEGEMYAKYYYDKFSLPITCLRFFTVYGVRSRPDMLIRKYYDSIFNNREFLVFGDGSQERDFTYISDIIDGILLSAESKTSSGEIFNLGRSKPCSIEYVIDTMSKIANKPKNVRYIGEQKGDAKTTYADISKAKRVLGYNPKVCIEEGLQKQYDWQKTIM